MDAGTWRDDAADAYRKAQASLDLLRRAANEGLRGERLARLGEVAYLALGRFVALERAIPPPKRP